MNTQNTKRQRIQSPVRIRFVLGRGIASLTSTLLLLAGCGARVDSDGNPASSQTHWLQGCDSAAECGGLECLCGVCTQACDDNASCSSFGGSSVCTTLDATCKQSACTKSCEDNGDCVSGSECHDGTCRLEPEVEVPVTPIVSSSFQPLGAPDGGTLGYELGHACEDDDECASGACRTATCFEEDAVCVSLSGDIECNADVVEYCGCDGVTFEGSSGGYGCAGAPYAYVGACGNQLQPAGASCEVDEDCQSGTCEGVGCGAFEGKCAEEDRACTDDLRPYCGCDGVMFYSSGTCPGARYSEEMNCPSKAPDGDSCESHDDCASGICEGDGCDAPGRCVPEGRICTDDLVPYCGCDGTVFYGSSSCPGGRYADLLECQTPEGGNCNTNDDCASGICEGLGCGELEGTCAPRERTCTEDEVPYCTCDGTTVYGSSGCPEVRYASEGECD